MKSIIVIVLLIVGLQGCSQNLEYRDTILTDSDKYYLPLLHEAGDMSDHFLCRFKCTNDSTWYTIADTWYKKGVKIYYKLSPRYLQYLDSLYKKDTIYIPPSCKCN